MPLKYSMCARDESGPRDGISGEGKNCDGGGLVRRDCDEVSGGIGSIVGGGDCVVVCYFRLASVLKFLI